jgi:hypothetical protein
VLAVVEVGDGVEHSPRGGDDLRADPVTRQQRDRRAHSTRIALRAEHRLS